MTLSIPQTQPEIPPLAVCREEMDSLPGASLNRLSDADDIERERHIADCGRLMLAAYSRYEVTSDLQDRAEADRWRLKAEAIAARGPAQVAALETERGLA
jgi:hypothetical protein